MSTPRVVAIVQARMESTRLPGKVFADIEGAPMLNRVVQRLRQCKRVHAVVVTTPKGASNAQIGKALAGAGAHWYPWWSGDPNDVLGRYVAAAWYSRAEVVVRVTADCPLIDPATVDRVVGMLLEEPRADYASNVLERTYPRGLDVEAMWLDTLLRLDRHTTDPAEREHVTHRLLKEGEPLFTALSLSTDPNRRDWRWTVDTPADLEYVRALYRACGLANRILPYEEVAALIESGKAPRRLESDEPERTVPVT